MMSSSITRLSEDIDVNEEVKEGVNEMWNCLQTFWDLKFLTKDIYTIIVQC